MGAFHEGHLTLIREGRKKGDILCVSIFVNPLQFDQKEDFKRYPRTLARDLKEAEKLKTDYVFVPSGKEMYPPGYQTQVIVKELSQPLCGRSRPGHFEGVTTVVLKLFNIVRPHIAIFGYKDYQQLKVIKQMVKDLNLDIEIIGMPIVRDKDGVALSSRNLYLSKEGRRRAKVIPTALQKVLSAFNKGERKVNILTELALDTLERGCDKIDYISFCDPETLKEYESDSFIDDKVLFALAVYIEGARLIDNIILDSKAEAD
jgi:pantoate--beta-alanine ligase